MASGSVRNASFVLLLDESDAAAYGSLISKEVFSSETRGYQAEKMGGIETVLLIINHKVVIIDCSIDVCTSDGTSLHLTLGALKVRSQLAFGAGTLIGRMRFCAATAIAICCTVVLGPL